MRKLLYSRESGCIQPLRRLVEQQSHRALVLWALDCAVPYLDFFEKNRPGEGRPRAVLVAAEQWARGRVKMPEAKRAIHAAHDAAAEVGDATRRDASVMAAGRAIGHAAATVHVETHALGLAFYGLTSKYYMGEETQAGRGDTAVEEELARLTGRLLYWEQNAPLDGGPWADFLSDDAALNKELLLRQKSAGKKENPAAAGTGR